VEENILQKVFPTPLSRTFISQKLRFWQRCGKENFLPKAELSAIQGF